jgi:hypothetical protein
MEIVWLAASPEAPSGSMFGVQIRLDNFFRDRGYCD